MSSAEFIDGSETLDSVKESLNTFLEEVTSQGQLIKGTKLGNMVEVKLKGSMIWTAPKGFEVAICTKDGKPRQMLHIKKEGVVNSSEGNTVVGHGYFDADSPLVVRTLKVSVYEDGQVLHLNTPTQIDGTFFNAAFGGDYITNLNIVPQPAATAQLTSAS